MVSQAMSLSATPIKRDRTEPAGAEPDYVERAVGGDTRAFEWLYRVHVPRIHGLCMRMCRDPYEAEECTQEAFVQAWQKLHLFRGDSEIGTWLHRVAVNTVLGRMRKSKREKDRLTFVSELPDSASPGNGISTTDDIEAALKHLPGGARSIVVLVGIYGYSHGEVSAMLGIAVGTCKAQLHRARKLLAAELALAA